MLFKSIVYKRIHQPKLNVFYIGLFEVRCVDFTHHTPPTFLRVIEITIYIVVQIEIIRSTFLGIKAYIKYRQYGCPRKKRLSVGEDLFFAHFASKVIRKQIFIISHINRGLARVFIKHIIINRIPREQSSILTVIYIIAQPSFGEKSIGRGIGRSRGEKPIVRIFQVDRCLCRFEVVEIGISGIILDFFMSGYHLCKFARKLYGRRCRKFQQRQFVESCGKPLHLFFISSIQSPDSIRYRFTSHSCFSNYRHLRHMHHCSADKEVFVESIF